MPGKAIAPGCAPKRGAWRALTRHTAVPHVLVFLMHEFLSALCLIAVIEGLLLFAAPTAWKRMVEQLFSLPTAQLRAIGGVTLVLGAIALWVVRH